MHDEVAIDAAFPGGNIVVDEMDGDEVRLHQDLRDTERDWFYWYFRVRPAPAPVTAARTLKFTFTQSQALGVRGPGVSLDGGHSWVWLGADAVEGNSFSYTLAGSPGVASRADAPQAEVRFSFGMPYQVDRWRGFMTGLADHPRLQRRRLCTSIAGRQVEYAVIGDPEATPRHRVAIACRTHCCEMMASYALEGLVEWIALDGADGAAWLRHEAQIIVVPFVDPDGVEAGDQGKGRRPRDHGRDYAGDSVYAETAAIRRLLPDFGAGRLHVCLDLHCPWISGPRNEVIFLPGSSHEAQAREQRRFSQLLEDGATGPLPVSAADFLPYGTSWNTAANHTEGIGLSGWAAGLPGVRLATGVELPYATAGGAEVNQQTAKRFGIDLGQALAAYLRVG